MTQLAESLVGRDAELALLDGLLEETCQGAYNFAVVRGEPGIGKTSLLTELASRAEERGCLVLEGRATELERELPFGLLVDTFDAYLESLDPRAYDRLAADGLGELASVFPSLRGLGEGSEQPSTPVERFRAYYAVRELIERLAVKHPLVLAFDDIHWSDGASLELLGYLLRRPPQAAVLGVAAFRSGQASPALAATIEERVRGDRISELTLGPLSPEDAEKLVADGAEADRLYEESGGNPFYLLQLARSGNSTSKGAAGDGYHSREGVPAAVSVAIARELEGLSPEVRALVEAAAVAGDPFEVDLAVATAAMAEPDALAALDALIARDLIRAGEAPRSFQFRHPLVRAAVYEGCSPGSRLAAHERAAEALAERRAAAHLRAHHVEQSARHGDMDAVGVLREAGAAAAERAPSSAARWFRAALRILPEDAPPEDRATLLLGLGGALAATGKLEGSHSALMEALELPGEAVPMPRVKLISACAGVEQLLGRREDAHERLAAALRELPDHTSREAAALMFELALDAFYGQDYEGMRDWGVKAVDGARALGDDPLRAAAAALTAFACTLRPETISEAHDFHAEAAAAVDAMSDDELAQELNGPAWLAAAEFYLDRYSEGIVHAERGLAVARATGQGDFFPALVQALANLLFSSGRPREAAEVLDGALEASRLSDNAVGVAWSLLNRSFCASCAGETEDALRTGEEAVGLARNFGDSPVAAWAAAVYGLALVDAGDARRAHDVLVGSCGGDEMLRIPGPWRVNWLGVMTRCWLGLGRADDAARAAALAEEEAARFGLPLSTAAAHRASAAVALESGDAAAAAERALASAAGAQEIGARIDVAHSRLLAGRALASVGERDAAVAELERAAAEFEACGAPRHRDRAERELRKLGRAVHRRSERGDTDGVGLRSLTGRELEVARLVVDRRTNPEIADELFLSIKTVETHMRNIFRKLNASSRVEVARILEREPAPSSV